MRRFLPREHGLLAWVGLPLLAALVLAPRVGTGLAALAVVLGFGAFNAARRAEWRAAGGAMLLAAGMAAAAETVIDWPGLLLGTLSLALLAAGGALTTFGERLPRAPALEVLGLAGLNAVGMGLAISGGAPWDRAITLSLVLLCWQVTGLWWVRRSLAAVLPRRAPWRPGLGLALALAASAVAAGCWYGLLTIPAVLLLYPLRMALHGAPGGPRDAARVGFTELGWSVLAIGLAALGAG